jgi:uncharacterized membrane protein
MDDHSATVSTSEALRFGWEKTKAHLKPLLLLGLAGAFLALLNRAFARPHGMGDPVLLLFIQALQVGVAMLFARVALLAHDGEPVRLGHLGKMLEGYITFFASTLICELIVAAGLVLLVVPGVLWAARFCFAPLLVLDRELDPIEALHESARLTRGARGALIKLGLALLGLNLLGALALGLGLFVTVPVTFLATVRAMRVLQAHHPAGVEPALTATPATSH